MPNSCRCSEQLHDQRPEHRHNPPLHQRRLQLTLRGSRNRRPPAPQDPLAGAAYSPARSACGLSWGPLAKNPTCLPPIRCGIRLHGRRHGPLPTPAAARRAAWNGVRRGNRIPRPRGIQRSIAGGGSARKRPCRRQVAASLARLVAFRRIERRARRPSAAESGRSCYTEQDKHFIRRSDHGTRTTSQRAVSFHPRGNPC